MAVIEQITDLLVDVELGDRSARAALDYDLHYIELLRLSKHSESQSNRDGGLAPGLAGGLALVLLGTAANLCR